MLNSRLNSRSAGSTRAFVGGVASVVLVSLCAMVLMNWVENPFSSFSIPALRHINDMQSSAILVAGRPQQLRWLANRGHRLGGGPILLGSSQVYAGMDTCSYPTMERLAIPYLSLNDTAEFLRSANLKAPVTLLIAQNLMSTDHAKMSKDGPMATWRDLLAPATTRAAMTNLMDSVSSDRPPCAAVADASTRQAKLSVEYARKGLSWRSGYLSDSSGLEDVLAALTPLCRRLHPRVVVFTLPTYFTPEIAPELLSVFRQNALRSGEVIDNFNRHSDGCTVFWLDLATTYMEGNPLGPAPEDWFNLLHFKPKLGDRILESVVAASTQTAATRSGADQ